MINRFDRDGTRHFNGALVLHDDVLNLENENKMLREALGKVRNVSNYEKWRLDHEVSRIIKKALK